MPTRGKKRQQTNNCLSKSAWRNEVVTYMWWIKTEVPCYLTAIKACMAVCQDCSNSVHSWNALQEDLLIFLEINKRELRCDFAETPLHCLSYRTHTFVERLLVRWKHGATVWLHEEGPQGIRWISIYHIAVTLHQPLQFRVEATVSEYAWKTVFIILETCL